MNNVRVDPEVLDIITMRLPANMDEAEIRYWMSMIPEAKSYIMRKIKVANRRINDIETYLELLEEKYNRHYVFNSNDGSITERKAFAKNKLIMSKEYNRLAKELNKLTEVVEEYNIQLEVVNEKSLAVRKLANFELNNPYYDE